MHAPGGMEASNHDATAEGKNPETSNEVRV